MQRFAGLVGYRSCCAEALKLPYSNLAYLHVALCLENFIRQENFFNSFFHWETALLTGTAVNPELLCNFGVEIMKGIILQPAM